MRYGPRALDVRRGSGDCDCERLWVLLVGEGAVPGCCPANRSSHMAAHRSPITQHTLLAVAVASPSDLSLFVSSRLGCLRSGIVADVYSVC